MERIENVRTRHQMGHEDFVRAVCQQRRRRGFDVPDHPVGIVEDVALEARIDHGRWLVDCPSCAGAELVDPEDLRFFCLSCYNAAHDGQWLHVILPENRGKIETELLKRRKGHRHWRPGVTLADLQIGNAVEGLE